MKKEKKFVPLSQSSTRRKISFFSTMFIAVGSCIGAGIFFKAQAVINNSNGSLVLAILTWIIAAISVIAMALALVEIASARNDNLSMIGWCKTFNSDFIYKVSKNFIFYIYLPITFFCMPLYVIQAMQDSIFFFKGGAKEVSASFGTNYDWLIWSIIAISISTYFIFISGLSSKAGNIQNKIILLFKFIPLVFAALIGFILLGLGAKATAQVEPIINGSLATGSSLASMTPGIGMFLGIGAIFFAFDGFYVSAGIETEMEEPKKAPLAIVLGLLLVTIIYLVIAISMSIVGNGSINDLNEVMINQLKWNATSVNIILGIMNLLISFGILGILNGFGMWSSRFAEELLKIGDLPFARKYYNKLSLRRPIVGTIYTLVAFLVITIIFSLIGALGYENGGGYNESKYGNSMGSLYSFADLMASWISVFSFAFIIIPIIGGIINRKTNKIHTKRVKFFIPLAWTSVIIAGIALIVQILIPVLDLLLIPALKTDSIQESIHIKKPDLDIIELLKETNARYNEIIISRIMLIIVLLITLFGSILPIWAENILISKKYKSKQDYLEQKRIFFNLENKY